MRMAVAEIVRNCPDLAVCGEASDAGEALRLVQEKKPDLALIDLTLKEGSGMDLVKQIKAMAPQVRMIVLSLHDEKLYAERVIRAGAMGYVNKGEAGEVIMDAIRRVLEGKIYLSRKMAEEVLQRLSGNTQQVDRGVAEKLSDRELVTFELIGRGKSTREIAAELYVSPKTVDSYCQRIKQKLNLASGRELMRHAVEWTMSRG
jgi:DNA-binding NarL/FixJ family response regulator